MEDMDGITLYDRASCSHVSRQTSAWNCDSNTSFSSVCGGFLLLMLTLFLRVQLWLWSGGGEEGKALLSVLDAVNTATDNSLVSPLFFFSLFFPLYEVSLVLWRVWWGGVERDGVSVTCMEHTHTRTHTERERVPWDEGTWRRGLNLFNCSPH